jgi:hypothetical protein
MVVAANEKHNVTCLLCGILFTFVPTSSHFAVDAAAELGRSCHQQHNRISIDNSVDCDELFVRIIPAVVKCWPTY